VIDSNGQVPPNTIINIFVPYSLRNFLTSCVTVSYSRTVRGGQYNGDALRLVFWRWLVQKSARRSVIMINVLVNFGTPSNQILGQYLVEATTAFFHMLFSLPLTNCTIKSSTVLDTSSLKSRKENISAPWSCFAMLATRYKASPWSYIRNISWNFLCKYWFTCCVNTVSLSIGQHILTPRYSRVAFITALPLQWLSSATSNVTMSRLGC
jgi:hypothetical protein